MLAILALWILTKHGTKEFMPNMEHKWWEHDTQWANFMCGSEIFEEFPKYQEIGKKKIMKNDEKVKKKKSIGWHFSTNLLKLSDAWFVIF